MLSTTLSLAGYYLPGALAEPAPSPQ